MTPKRLSENPLEKSPDPKKSTCEFFSSSCVIFFVRAPEPGKVKTRLAQVIGNDAASQLYKSFVADELDMLRNLCFDVTICYHPQKAQQRVRNWLKAESNFLAQTGNNLGQRMANAFHAAFLRGYQRAVLIGSDLPDLPSSMVFDALDQLEKFDAVIGPCEDGGYYLIGFCRDAFCPEIFLNIPWGTSWVLKKTLLKLHDKKLSCHTLPPWQDIDNYNDLMRLKKILDKNPNLAKHTYETLLELSTESFTHPR